MAPGVAMKGQLCSCWQVPSGPISGFPEPRWNVFRAPPIHRRYLVAVAIAADGAAASGAEVVRDRVIAGLAAHPPRGHGRSRIDAAHAATTTITTTLGIALRLAYLIRATGGRSLACRARAVAKLAADGPGTLPIGRGRGDDRGGFWGGRIVVS